MKQNTIYALGFFDGVHLGHQALLKACRELADQYGCQAGVVTFGNHPDALVQGNAPRLINSLSDRKRLLEEFHMDKVLELPFLPDIRRPERDNAIDQYLLEEEQENLLAEGVWQQYFTEKPARSCVAVKELPKGVLVEIEVIAYV